MTITKRTEIVSAIVDLKTGNISIREDTIVEESGTEIARSTHRTLKTPGETVPAAIQALSESIWTPELVQASVRSKQDAANTVESLKPTNS